MLWERRTRMQVRRELDASKRGPGAPQWAPGGPGVSRGSRSARGRAPGTGPEGTGRSGGGWRGERSRPGIGQRQQHLPGHAGRRADPRRGPRLRRRRAPAAGAPAKPHPPPSRPPSSLSQAAKLLAHRKRVRPPPEAARSPSPHPAFGLGRPVSGPLVTGARAPKSPSCSEAGNFRRRGCLLLGCRLESVRQFAATLALAPPSRKLPRVPPNSGSAT